MTFKRSVVGAVLIGASAFSGSALAGVSGNVSVASDYIYRGIAQTGGTSVVQGGLDYGHESGFYVGTWASSLGDGLYELNHYAGFAFEAGGVSFDLGALLYHYPDSSASDTAEYTLGVGFGALSLSYSYSPDWFSTDEDASYLNAGYSFELSDSVALDLALGYSFGDGIKASVGEEYLDYSVSVSKSVTDALSASFAVVGTDKDSEDGLFYDGPRFYVSAAYEFDL